MKRTLPIIAGAGLIAAAVWFGIGPESVSPQPKTARLEWDASPEWDSNVLVVIQSSPDTVRWSDFATVRTSPVLIALTNPRQFFRAYATNPVTGVSSLP